jgi:hypothetical protein
LKRRAHVLDGKLTYGTKGRLISALAIILAFTGSLEASGALTLLPEKYKWIGLVVTLGGLVITGFSERLQGGASNPEVREQAARSDAKNEKEALNR